MGDIDLQPTLIGSHLLLRPLRADDFSEIFAVAADPLIWEQNPDPNRYKEPVFRKLFDAGLGSTLVVIERATGKMIGWSRYYDWNADAREAAIGYTFLARSHWGGETNREMKRLMLDHITQWADSVWFHIGVSNMRSRKAMEKIGGVLSHEAMRDVNGVPTPYRFYKITAGSQFPD